MRFSNFVNGGYAVSNFNTMNMSGPLILYRNPELPNEAATKQYVDTNDALKVNKAGDTLTGFLTLHANPTNNLHAATKQYVDANDALKVNKAGDTLTGFLTLHANPTNNLHAATKQYVDTQVATKANSTHTHTLSQITDWPSEVSITELTYLDGVTSNIQTQLNAKVNKAGDTLTGFLTLHADPTSNLHAATKQYVDTQVATKANTSHTHTLSNITDWPAAVDATEVSYLDGVTSNIQTQLNAKVNKAGDTLTGFLTLHANPTNNLHAATKQYVDNLEVVKTGSLLRKTDNTVPNGYLYCDGSFVSKTTYSSLFTILGTKFDNADQFCLIDYLKYTSLGEGKPWIYNCDINYYTGTDLNNTVANGTLPASISRAACIVTNKRVFLLGGWNGTSAVSTVYTAVINDDGTLGAWSTSTALPGALCDSQAIVTKNRVYLLGGSSNGTNAVSTVYTAPINTDGTLGSWSTGTSLPGALSKSQAFTTISRVYLIGGSSNGSNAVTTVYSAPINSDGTLGTWVTDSATLPAAISTSSLAIVKNNVYLIGGWNGSAAVATVYKSTVNANGTLSSWTSAPSLPSAKYAGTAILAGTYLFYLGGYNTTEVIRATLDSSGNFTTWNTATSLNHAISYSSSFITRDRIFFVGNYVGTSVSSNIYNIAFTGNGLNDYSLLYNNTINLFDGNYILGTKKFGVLGAPSSSVFRLPDYTDEEVNGYFTFIKF